MYLNSRKFHSDWVVQWETLFNNLSKKLLKLFKIPLMMLQVLARFCGAYQDWASCKN